MLEGFGGSSRGTRIPHNTCECASTKIPGSRQNSQYHNTSPCKERGSTHVGSSHQATRQPLAVHIMMNVSEEASHQYAEPRNLRTDPAVLSVRARGVHIAELEGFTSYTPRGPPEAQVDTPLPAVSRRTHLSCSSACSTSLFSFSFQRVFPSTSEVNCSPPALCTGKTGTTLVKLKTTAPPKPLPPGFHSANNNIKPEQITPGVTPQKLYSTCISSVGEEIGRAHV